MSILKKTKFYQSIFFAVGIFFLLCFIGSLKVEGYETNNKTITFKFISCFDGTEDNFVFLRALKHSPMPSKNIDKVGRTDKILADLTDGTLLIYFHSLTGNFNELFRSPLADMINKSYPNLSLLSCNYGHTPSWGVAPARMDITNNIRTVEKQMEVKHIILVGTSMGGFTALSYAATAPSYIKRKIIGIIAVAPCADLDDLYQKSMAPEVKPSLDIVFGGTPADKLAIYHQNSLDPYLAFLPRSIKIAIITAKEEMSVPIELQMNVVRDLNNRDMNVKTLELEGKSLPIPVDSIMEGLRTILQQNS